MRIGIDFDNTIADYTGVFHQVALELGWLPSHVGKSKAQVKAYFIEDNKEEKWTELQGLVYGKFISHAQPYANAKKVMSDLKQAGHELFIISHKTQYPFIGEQFNLHQAAMGWLVEQQIVAENIENSQQALLPSSSVFFNQKKEQKLAKAAELGCQLFIDDLVEILNHEGYPANCKAVLFDPEQRHLDYPQARISNWQELPACL